MLNLTTGGIPASLEFYQRLGVTVPADAADPHVQSVEPDTLLRTGTIPWKLDHDRARTEYLSPRGGPALDALLLRLHAETACRRGGALALVSEDLDAEHCLIQLHEKGETVRWQPVSPSGCRISLPTPEVAEAGFQASHHLNLAGRPDQIFTEDALNLIHTTSRGYPRAVNNLALQSLVAAFAASKNLVDEAAARSAVSEVVD